MTLYLSRLRLSRRPDVAALNALIDPAAPSVKRRDTLQNGRRTDAHHRLIWSAFATDPGRTRDFLWRDEGQGRFLVLSPDPPADSAFFEVPEVRPFAPDLRAGDRLTFLLRANATRTERTGTLSAGGREKRRHTDLVMDALHSVPKGERAPHRMDAAAGVARRWMVAQGERHGFTPDAVQVHDYSVAALPGHVGARRGQPQYGILDLSGALTVTDPSALVAAIGAGFGRAKAFGCGLMLIRRA